MALKRMDNVGILVVDLAATIDFFRELGLELIDGTLERLRKRGAQLVGEVVQYKDEMSPRRGENRADWRVRQ